MESGAQARSPPPEKQEDWAKSGKTCPLTIIENNFCPTGLWHWGGMGEVERSAAGIPATLHPLFLTGWPSKLTSQPFGMGLFSRLKMSPMSPLSHQEEASVRDIHSLLPVCGVQKC